MAVREVVLLGDPILRERAREVTAFDDDLKKLVRDMFDTMISEEGAGLAAPQVGVSQRVFVAEVVDDETKQRARVVFVNPELVRESEEVAREQEGCLSVPGVTEVVPRPARVTMRGFDVDGKEIEVEAGGLLGRVLQHEFDHLNGILFFDRISPLKRQILLKKYRKLEAEAGE